MLLSYAHRDGIADQLNGFIGELLKQFLHTAGLGTLHPKDTNLRGIILQAFDEFGLCGIKLHCHVQKVTPDDPLLFAAYGVVQEFGGILCIHAGKEPAIQAYGFDVRAITGASRVEKVLKRFPEMKMIVPHLGFDESDKFYELLEQYPHLYLDTTMMLPNFFPVSVDREKLIQYADRILFGTDYPHIPYPMETELEAILDMDLGEEATGKILFENAAELFPITPR